MSVHIFIFGPTPFVSSLVSLSQSEQLLTQVGTNFEDDDAALYDALNTKIMASLGQEGEDNKDKFLVLTPLFGDRYTTIALSIPYDELFVISGVSVPTLSLLHSHPEIVNMYKTKQIKSLDAHETINTIDTHKSPPLSIERLAEKLCENSKLGILFHEQYLREDGEDSNIDASILETDFSQFL